MVAARRIAANLGLGLVAEVFNKIFPLIVIRYVQSHLGLERFGYAQVAMTLVDLAVLFVVFGYHTSGSIAVGKADGDRKAAASAISEITTLKILHAAVAYLGLLAILSFFPSYTEYLPLVHAAGFVFLTSALDMSYVIVGTQKMYVLSVATFFAKLLSLVCIATFVTGADDVAPYVVLVFGGNACISLVTLIWTMKEFPFVRPTLVGLRRHLNTAIPFAITILLLGADRYDLLLAEYFFDKAGAGLYAAPLRLAQSLSPLVYTVGLVFFSESISDRSPEGTSRNASWSLWILLALTLPICVGVWFVDSELLALVMGESFAPAGRTFSILLLSLLTYVVLAVGGQQVLALNHRSGTLNMTILAGMLSGAILAYFLAPTYGLEGIAFGSILGKVLTACLIAMACLRFLVDFQWRLPSKPLIPAAFMFLILKVFPQGSLVGNIALGAFSYGALFAIASHQELRWLLKRRNKGRGSST